MPRMCCRGNFLFDPATGALNLIDFGAAKDYSPHFVADYLHMGGCARGAGVRAV